MTGGTCMNKMVNALRTEVPCLLIVGPVDCRSVGDG